MEALGQYFDAVRIVGCGLAAVLVIAVAIWLVLRVLAWFLSKLSLAAGAILQSLPGFRFLRRIGVVIRRSLLWCSSLICLRSIVCVFSIVAVVIYVATRFEAWSKEYTEALSLLYDGMHWVCIHHGQKDNYAAIGIGYFFSIFAGHLVIFPLLDVLREVLRKHVRERVEADDLYPHPELSTIVGLVERFLYTASWHVGKPQFIVVWLGLKVVGNWAGWTEGQKVGNKAVISGRSLSNVFVIGSGLSLTYAVVGALIIEWITSCRLAPALFVPASLITVTWLLKVFAQESLNSNKKNETGRNEHYPPYRMIPK